jgi:hypothetical protein
MRTTLLTLAALSLALGAVALATPAAAMCYYEEHTIDPVKKDTGTVVDAVKVTYGIFRCEPPPQ